MVFIFLGAMVALTISYFVAVKFADIAKMKGHDDNSYFWFTFLLGVYGMLMVVALPYVQNKKNNGMDERIDSLSWLHKEPTARPMESTKKADNDENKDNLPISAEISNGEKICPTCGCSQKVDRKLCWSCGQKFDN